MLCNDAPRACSMPCQWSVTLYTSLNLMSTSIYLNDGSDYVRSAAAHFQFQQSRSNHLVRKELQQHLYQHQQQLHGYIDYVQRHSHQLLTLIVDNPTQDPHSAETQVSAKEFDRLALLLRPADSQHSDSGSPMEISPSPFTGTSWSNDCTLDRPTCRHNMVLQDTQGSP